MDWLKLKSGSDVRGVACGENAVITGEVASALGMAFARRLADEKGKTPAEVTIALGRDSRITGASCWRPQRMGSAEPARGCWTSACAPRRPCSCRSLRPVFSRTDPL